MVINKEHEQAERQELIQKLIANGMGVLVDVFLTEEGKCYTSKARLNKSGACRALGWKMKQLNDALERCRQVLNEEGP